MGAGRPLKKQICFVVILVRENYMVKVCMNSGSVYLQYLSVDQAPIEGYFVYHKPYDASDSDYKKQTLLGATHSTHLLTELQANTQYSIKMRCFNAAGHSDESNTVVKKTLCQYLLLYSVYPVQDIVAQTFFKNLCHSQVIIKAAVTVPRTSMMSFSCLCCGLLLLLFPAIIHLRIVFQPVRVIYVSAYTYINLN